MSICFIKHYLPGTISYHEIAIPFSLRDWPDVDVIEMMKSYGGPESVTRFIQLLLPSLVFCRALVHRLLDIVKRVASQPHPSPVFLSQYRDSL